MTVTAVIPTWNRIDLLESILTNLGNQARPPEQTIVVDNGSSDASAEFARGQGARVIRFAENRGFAVAVNEGIRKAKTDYVLIVNNDVLLRPDWLRVAMEVAEAGNEPFVCGKLLRPGNNEIDGSFDLVSRAMYAWRCGYGKPDGPRWSERRRIFWAPMTAALFHKRVFERAGFLDERFESYYEDVEFGLRCALQGVQGLYEPRMAATHMSKTTLGKSSRRVYFNTARNQLYIMAAHFPAATLRRLFWPILAGQALSVLAATKQRNLLAAIEGKWAGLQAWRSMRGKFQDDGAKVVEGILTESEREIRALQLETGVDIYWKIYFALTWL